jgi:hypothetical protein
VKKQIINKCLTVFWWIVVVVLFLLNLNAWFGEYRFERIGDELYVFWYGNWSWKPKGFYKVDISKVYEIRTTKQLKEVVNDKKEK